MIDKCKVNNCDNCKDKFCEAYLPEFQKIWSDVKNTDSLMTNMKKLAGGMEQKDGYSVFEKCIEDFMCFVFHAGALHAKLTGDELAEILSGKSFTETGKTIENDFQECYSCGLDADPIISVANNLKNDTDPKIKAVGGAMILGHQHLARRMFFAGAKHVVNLQEALEERICGAGDATIH